MRIRSIKPEFWRSEDVASLDIEDRLLFIGLWSYVDDNGVGLDRLSSVAADLFAGDLLVDAVDTFARVSRGLARLSEASRIIRYTVSGVDYLEIVNWEKHQRIDKPANPRFPRSDHESATIREGVARPREGVAPGTEEQRNRGTGEQSPPKGGDTRKRGTRIPDPFIVTADMRRWASERCPAVDVDRSTEKFVNHWRSTTRNATKLDWQATWRNWLMNDQDRNQSKPTPTERARRTVQLATEIDLKEITA